jgi:hypothetical protein
MQARRHAAQRRRPCPRPAPDRRAAASFQERIIGFAGCVISGLFLNMFSMIRLTELMLGNPKPFAVCFTLGNMVRLTSQSACGA